MKTKLIPLVCIAAGLTARGTAHASFAVKPVLDALSPAYIDEMVSQPHTKAVICDLLMTHAGIEADVAERSKKISEYERDIAEGRRNFSGLGAIIEKYLLPFDYDERIRPTKLVKQARKSLREAQAAAVEFDRDFDSAVIKTLRVSGQNYFKRLLDLRDEYQLVEAQINTAVETISITQSRVRKLEAKLARPNLTRGDRINAYLHWRRANSFLRRHGQQVLDVFEKAKQLLPGVQVKTGHVIAESNDLVPYLASALEIQTKISKLTREIETRLEIVILIAIYSADAKD